MYLTKTRKAFDADGKHFDYWELTLHIEIEDGVKYGVPMNFDKAFVIKPANSSERKFLTQFAKEIEIVESTDNMANMGLSFRGTQADVEQDLREQQERELEIARQKELEELNAKRMAALGLAPKDKNED